MQWYAVYTLPRWEKKVALELEEAGFESYCPLQKVMRQWKDRRKLVELPLLKGYVLVKTDEASKWQVLDSRGVLNFVYWNKKPARVNEADISQMKAFLEEHSGHELSVQSLKVDEEVEVVAGLLMHHKGIVQAVKGNTAVLRIPSLGVYFTATIPLEKMKRASLLKK